MFAVIKTGGKQYKVKQGDTLSVEKLDVPQGEKFSISDVLMTNDGKKTAFDSKSKVEAEVVEHYKDDKVIIFKKKRRQNYRRKMGHRQMLTKIQINKIEF
ncbi:MAG: 50S ribosomal protein L21 [Alphaproteobacteria bacterium]|nr:MAG: 50S ribosomal protein L21 [Alphaproteobacteria bacterium]